MPKPDWAYFFDEAPMPRFNWDLLEFLVHEIRPDSTVLETGSGGGTLWLAKLAGHVTSYENQDVWFHRVLTALELAGLDHKVDLRNAGEQYSYRCFEQDNIGKLYDIVIIDGEDCPLCRVHTMGVGHQFVKPGGVIVVDDTERPWYKLGLDVLDSLGWSKIRFFGKDPFNEEKEALVYRRPL